MFSFTCVSSLISGAIFPSRRTLSRFGVASLFLLALSLPATAHAEAPRGKESTGFVPFAIPFSTPDTGWGVGGALLYYAYYDEDEPPHEIMLKGALTERDQLSVALEGTRYFDDGAYQIFSEITYAEFPTATWGVGNDTADDLEEEYTPETVYLKASLRKRTRFFGYVGPRLEFVRYEIIESLPGGIVEGGQLPGGPLQNLFGLGLHSTIDKRNSVFYPRTGSLTDVKVKGMWNTSDSSAFFQFEFDWRRYETYFNSHTFAIQFTSRLGGGDVPFLEMGQIGGDMIMRGYADGRYVDMNGAALQAEYRSPTWWRVRGVLFAGAGKVFEDLGSVVDGPIHFGGGAGLRIVLDKEESIPLRLDVGIDERGEPGVYLLMTEAF